MASLYEIDQAIMNCLDMETGEIIDGEKLDALQIERDTKIENIGLWIKNLLSDAEAYKAEKNAFAEREKAAKNRAESLKQYISEVLSGNKFETEKVKISFRRSEQVDITDFAALDDDYLKFKDPEPDKTKIKQSIKQGITVPGAQLIQGLNIQIK